MHNRRLNIPTKKEFEFRNKQVSFHHCWPTDDTFYFIFGERELANSKGCMYTIQLKYYVADNKWIIEIWLEDESNGINIDELDKTDANEYITQQEIEEVKKIASNFLF